MITGRTVEETCLLCGGPAEVGVRIAGFCICSECEELLVWASPDRYGYDELVARLRPIGISVLCAAAGSPVVQVDPTS